MKLFEMQPDKPLVFSDDQHEEYVKWFENYGGMDSKYMFFDGETDNNEESVDVLVEPFDYEPADPDVGIMNEDINYKVVAYGMYNEDDTHLMIYMGEINMSRRSDDNIREMLIQYRNNNQDDY